MRRCDTGDQLGQNNGLTETGTTEQTCLTTADERSEQVDHFDTSFKNFRVGRKFGNGRGLAVDWMIIIGLDVATLIDGITENIEDATERC